MRINEDRINVDVGSFTTYGIKDFLDNEFDLRIYRLLESLFKLKNDPFGDNTLANDGRDAIITYTFCEIYQTLGLLKLNMLEIDSFEICFVKHGVGLDFYVLDVIACSFYDISDKDWYDSIVQSAFALLYKYYDINNFIATDYVDDWYNRGIEKGYIKPLEYYRDEKVIIKNNNSIEQLNSNKTNYWIKLSEGKKTDLVKILFALHKLKFFENVDGGQVTKDELMKYLAPFLNIDLKNHERLLSQNLKQGYIDTVVKVFDDMKAEITNNHYLNKK